MADDRRLALEAADRLGEVVGDLGHALAGEDLWVRPCLLDRLRVIGPARRQRRVARLLEQLAPAPQLLGSSQSPWTKTTGVRPLALAFSICCVSPWVTVVFKFAFPWMKNLSHRHMNEQPRR